MGYIHWGIFLVVFAFIHFAISKFSATVRVLFIVVFGWKMTAGGKNSVPLNCLRTCFS